MSEHSYAVTPVVAQDDRNLAGAIMRYRADCTCGSVFPLRDRRDDAGIDGLDHVRTVRGEKTRSAEIAEEKAAKAAARR